MTKGSACLECGAPLTGENLEGFCRRCVGRLVFDPALYDAPAPEMAPERFWGDFELIEEVGRGGMGVVWRARQRSLNRMVALKFIASGPLANREFRHRFRQEAATAARLRHPHIVAVYEAGEHEGHAWLAMEWVGGRSVAELARMGPLPARNAAELVVTVAGAVSHAHAHGVIHRDLKPSNILLDVSGQPQIADFGLAQDVSTQSDLTRTGQALGSPSFCAPEQARGETRGEASFTTDVYGLGAVLYHLLTGRPPFLGTTIGDTLHAVQHEEPISPRQLNAAIPRDVETICLKCLEKEPGRRYATAQELAEELIRFLQGEPIHARPIGAAERAWRWCQRKPVIAGLAAATVVLISVVLVGTPIAAVRINQSRTLAIAEGLRAAANALDARHAQYASDMNLAYQAVLDGDLFRARQLLERHVPRFVAPAVGISGPTIPSALSFSSNPDRMEAVTPTDLRGWEWRYLWKQCQGEELFTLGQHSNGVTSVGFQPDGRTAFSAGWDQAVRFWNLETREEVGAINQEVGVVAAAVSPDGHILASAITRPANTSDHPLRLWDLRTKTVIATVESNHWPRASIAFSPDGRYFAFASVETIGLWDRTTSSLVTNWSQESPTMDPRAVAFSPDGRLLAFNTRMDGGIQLWNLESQSPVGELVGHSNDVSRAAFSPDGRTLASGSHDGTLRLWDVIRGTPTANQRLGQTPRALSFSPDGRTIAVAFGQQVGIVDAAHGQLLGQLIGHHDLVTAVAYSPGADRLLTGSLDGTVRVWNASPQPKVEDTRELSGVILWSSHGPALCLSQNGRHALTAYTNGTFSLWNTDLLLEGPRFPLPFERVAHASIAPDGQQVAFCSDEGREIVLWDAVTQRLRPFVSLSTHDAAYRVDFSSDGRLLAAAGSAVWVFDVSEARLLQASDRIPGDGSVMELSFADHDRELLLGSFQGDAMTYKREPSLTARTFHGHTEQVRGLALLPDGKTLFSVSTDGSLRIWDRSLRREVRRIRPRRIQYNCAALSPDGRRVAAGASDGVIAIWDTDSLQEVARLKAHRGRVQRMAFTEDGGTLVSIGPDQIRVWRGAASDEAHFHGSDRTYSRLVP